MEPTPESIERLQQASANAKTELDRAKEADAHMDLILKRAPTELPRGGSQAKGTDPKAGLRTHPTGAIPQEGTEGDRGIFIRSEKLR
jgi:hypothetical protein